MNVTTFNSCIERLALHWQKHDVICINITLDYLYGKNRVPTTCFFSKDGIHLSRSGIKRLLENISTVRNSVDNYDCCILWDQTEDNLSREEFWRFELKTGAVSEKCRASIVVFAEYRERKVKKVLYNRTYLCRLLEHLGTRHYCHPTNGRFVCKY